ncbi:MAG: flagellar hook capping FlgD N-terminal domain-containing protein [Rubrivivax sp.]
MTTFSTDTLNAINGTSTPATTGKNSQAASSDRFLKLLVTQMQNQDPLNPMDNAQITSQMAQISTVDGLTKLNTTVEGLNSQFLQMQTLQGAALVGRDVTLKGNGLWIENGVGVGAFELAGAADTVKVEVLNASGTVVDTLQLGAASAGVGSFEWAAGKVADGSLYTFRVTAQSGTAAVASTALMRDRVYAVATEGGALQLELARSGNVGYSDIKAFN